MDDKDTKKNIEDLAQNSDLALEQGQKMIESIDGLEPIMEGILITLQELPEKMGYPTESSNKKLIEKLNQSIEKLDDPISINVKLNLI